MDGEIVTLNFGHGGCQLGFSAWELFCLEHGVNKNGTLIDARGERPTNSFFSEKANGRFLPRTLFADLDEEPIDTIRTGPLKKLFEPNDLAYAKKGGTGHNFARGYFTDGRELSDVILDQVSRLTEACNNLQGFIVYHSMGGGTGSGLTARIMQNLSVRYDKKSKISMSILPSPVVSSVAQEPYNAVLNHHFMSDHVDVAFLYDNEAVCDIGKGNLQIATPNYTQMNQMISQAVSATTTNLRFGVPRHELNEFQTRLVSYKRLHFIQTAYAPFMMPAKAQTTDLNTNEVTREALKPHNQMAKYDPKSGKVMSLRMQFLGRVPLGTANQTKETIKATIGPQFVDDFYGINVDIDNREMSVLQGSPFAKVNRSACMLSNTTATATLWSRVTSKFDEMYQRRAFLQDYMGAGMTDADFDDARMTLHDLEQEYQDVENPAGPVDED